MPKPVEETLGEVGQEVESAKDMNGNEIRVGDEVSFVSVVGSDRDDGIATRKVVKLFIENSNLGKYVEAIVEGDLYVPAFDVQKGNEYK